jgi:hypothetical protein
MGRYVTIPHPTLAAAPALLASSTAVLPEQWQSDEQHNREC